MPARPSVLMGDIRLSALGHLSPEASLVKAQRPGITRICRKEQRPEMLPTLTEEKKPEEKKSELHTC